MSNNQNAIAWASNVLHDGKKPLKRFDCEIPKQIGTPQLQCISPIGGRGPDWHFSQPNGRLRQLLLCEFRFFYFINLFKRNMYTLLKV
jgi:hypothetical protein